MTNNVIELRVNEPSELVALVRTTTAISRFLEPKGNKETLAVSQRVTEEVQDFLKIPENPLMKSGDLLRKFGSPVSAVKFNNLAVENGLLVLQERSSTKYAGIQRQYKVIPNEYLCYGKNLVSSSNQKETQPYWFESTFQEVLNKLGVTK